MIYFQNFVNILIFLVCFFFLFLSMSPEWEAPIRFGIRYTTFLSDHYDRATRIDERQFPYRCGIGLKRSIRGTFT